MTPDDNVFAGDTMLPIKAENKILKDVSSVKGANSVNYG